MLFSNHAARRMTVDPSAHGDGLCERLALARPDDEGGGALDVRDLMPASEGDRIRGRRVVSMTSEGSVYLLADAARLPALHDHPAVAVLSLRDMTECSARRICFALRCTCATSSCRSPRTSCARQSPR